MNEAEKKQKVAIEVTKKFADEGKLIEAGFAAMQIIALQNAPPAQIDDMRLAYMAGAEHLYSSMLAVMDPGEEPTERDMKRMELIHNEIQAWREVLQRRFGRKTGHA